MRITIQALLLFLFLSPQAIAQDDISFKAFSDAKKVVMDGYFEISFTLSNANGSQFRPPSFSEFIVVSGPNRSIQTSIINGRGSMELTYSYSLQPRKKGKFTIGKASINVDSKIFETNPVSIEVVEGSTIAGSNENTFYVEAMPSVKEAYIGQQINLAYRLFTTVNIESYNILEEADYAGFYAEDLTRFETRLSREIINNIQYITRTLKSIAIYPQQTGSLTIDPMQLQLGVVSNDGRPGNLFFSRPIKRVPASTNPVSIKVKALPDNAPSLFNGAVGQFKLITGLNKKVITTNDAFVLSITISGNGDIKRIQAPSIELGEQFEVYDPTIKEESTFELNGIIVGKKSFEYIIVPKKRGNYQINPSFCYFDPDSAKYVVLNKDKYDIIVKGGIEGDAPAIADLPETEEIFLKPIKTKLSLSKKGNNIWGNPIHLLLYFLPFIILLSIWTFKRIQQRKLNIDPLILRQQKAQKIAQERLDKAKEYLQANQARNFYDEVSKAMITYVSNKLEIPLSSLTKDNVRMKLDTLSIKDEEKEQFMKILQNCEMALFAGKDNTEAMAETYENALKMLVDIELK